MYPGGVGFLTCLVPVPVQVPPQGPHRVSILHIALKVQSVQYGPQAAQAVLAHSNDIPHPHAGGHLPPWHGSPHFQQSNGEQDC